MDRRQLIKAGLTATGIAAVGLAGCNVKENMNNIDIIPKQTGQYQFSHPLPFDFNLIDKLVEINSQYKKSKITSLYNNIPMPIADKFNGWYACQRGFNYDFKDYKQFAKYAEYAQKKGFKIVYLLNSPKTLTEEDYNKTKKDFYELLDFIHDIGIREIKVGSAQVADLINEYKYNFDLSASINFNYQHILEYYHLIDKYSNIKLVDVSTNLIQNFKFLKSFRKLFPDVKIELMVNLACMKGCPAISHHTCSYFKVFPCFEQIDNPYDYYVKAARIQPWEFEYYSAIGINNFKIDAHPRANLTKLGIVKNYFEWIENGVNNVKALHFLKVTGFNSFNKKIVTNDSIMFEDITKYLPDINYFIKHGHECSTKCRVECTYCYDCARKLEQKLTYG